VASSTAQPVLAHQFASLEHQRASTSLGMWVFLVTEIMFFGGLFTAYIAYRPLYGEAFTAASHHLDIRLGGINTAVLIASSFTMAMAVRSAQLGRRRPLAVFLALTMLLGLAFLRIKGIEYGHKFEEHLIPGADFRFSGADPRHAQLFFSLYFVMTGLHALHMIIGVGVLSWLLVLTQQGRISAEQHDVVECTGLYWHFVDIVWIFLFPLLYLIGRH
jgi:cytochrome c oxidase subunit 3